MENIEDKISGLLHGYQGGLVLMTACELGVFDALTGPPVSALEVAEKLGLSEKGVERLLNALAALGIAAKDNEKYSLPEEWLPYLTKDGERSMHQWMWLSKKLIQPWLEMDRFVRSGENISSIMDMLGSEPENMRAFTDAMHDKGLKATWTLAREIPIGDCKKMLDLGGGPGTYSLEWCKLHPHLKATILDIPPVLEVAKEYIKRYGLKDRVTTKPGDFHKDGLGTEYDLVLLANILHMYEGDQGRALVQKAADCLAPGGRIVIHGFCTDDGDVAPLNDVLFSVNIGLLTPGGRAHPVKEKIDWLEAAGIGEIRHFRVDAVPTGVVTGVKKG